MIIVESCEVFQSHERKLSNDIIFFLNNNAKAFTSIAQKEKKRRIQKERLLKSPFSYLE